MKHRILRSIFALLALSLIINAPRAQQSAPSSNDRVELYQALLDLQNPWTVMCIAAHPDDEDGTSLIVMRRKFGAHTVSLFSTFGEGGQNAIGPELYEELGAIRARETMAAAEIQGSEPHFLGLKDFGFSKTRDEAFKFWGHEEGLRRMVLEIRKLRPDVIITNHSTTSNDHGQHQATALMVVEAFDAAADPNKFPEQLKDGVTTWQVQRLFVRARGNQAANDSTSIVTIDPNEKDPVRGVVYAEEALRALQKHATQGPWPKTFAEYATRFRAFSGQQGGTPGQLPMIRYALVREAKGAAALSAKESHNFLDGLPLLDAAGKEIALPDTHDSILRLADRTEGTAAFLKMALSRVSDSPMSQLADIQRRQMMRQKLERATAVAAGLNFKLQPSSNPVIRNSIANVTVNVENSGREPIDALECGPSPAIVQQSPSVIDDRRVNHATATRLAPGAVVTVSDKFQIPVNASINVPLSKHLYEPTGLGTPLITRCSYELLGKRVGIDLPITVDVASPVEIVTVTPAPAPVPSDKAPERSGKVQIPFEVTLINHQSVAFNGRLEALDGLFGNPINDMPLKLAPGEKRTEKFLVDGPVSRVKNNSVTFVVKDARWSSLLADVPIFATNASVAPSLSVGYVRGFDFSLPNALNALGVESKELSVEDVKTADLSKYTSVIVDNRVYESKPELIAANQKLLDYANAGGTLIVFYHKSDEWNPNPQRNRPQLAPYKLVLGNERVTDENAPISFLEPDHPLLNVPNKMGQDDFKDWIQERGLYYPREWDPQFHALLQSNDPGEAPLKGGLLVADYGKGHYIYTSMVWYRELRGGIPGAYRMLANMISYGR
ncbi:MAG TPA: PIG-L family deacetylase [Pyrinomonadaceae bacterium]|nr:PIG-L family deacetylase [Pyrinomonadaceae bacterium]